MKKLFQYAVLYHTYEEGEKGKKYIDTVMVIQPTTMLAKTEQDVVFKVTREIPEEFAEKPENVQILVKNF